MRQWCSEWAGWYPHTNIQGVKFRNTRTLVRKFVTVLHLALWFINRLRGDRSISKATRYKMDNPASLLGRDRQFALWFRMVQTISAYYSVYTVYARRFVRKVETEQTAKRTMQIHSAPRSVMCGNYFWSPYTFSWQCAERNLRLTHLSPSTVKGLISAKC